MSVVRAGAMRYWWLLLSVLCGFACTQDSLFSNTHDSRDDCAPEKMEALLACISKGFGPARHYLKDNLWLRMETGNFEFDFDEYAKSFKAESGCARGNHAVCLNLQSFPRAFVDMHFEIGASVLLSGSARCGRHEIAASSFRVAHYSARTFVENDHNAYGSVLVEMLSHLSNLCGEYPHEEMCHNVADYFRSQEMFGTVTHNLLYDFCKNNITAAMESNPMEG